MCLPLTIPGRKGPSTYMSTERVIVVDKYIIICVSAKNHILVLYKPFIT